MMLIDIGVVGFIIGGIGIISSVIFYMLKQNMYDKLKKSEILLAGIKMQVYLSDKGRRPMDDLDDIVDTEILLQLNKYTLNTNGGEITDVMLDQMSTEVFVKIKTYMSDVFINLLEIEFRHEHLDEYILRRIYLKMFELAKHKTSEKIKRMDDINN